MIVISGVLLLVAVVCLVIGLFSSLVWVYVSITVSVVSFAFLLLGVRQRKDLPVTAGAPTAAEQAGTSRIRTALGTDGADDADVTLVAPRALTRNGAEPASVASGARTVLVVAGRPRYHVAGCRYLNGRVPEQRSVAEAVAEGFTACGVCRPDEVLTGEQTAPDAPAAAVTAPVALVETQVPPAAPGRRATAAKAAPTPAAPAEKRPPKSAAKPAAPGTEPTKAPVRAPVKAPAKKAAAVPAPDKLAPAKRAAAAAAAEVETVIVIPDRDKYHRDDCRYVRGVDGTQEIAKAQARRAGFQPCGVCKP